MKIEEQEKVVSEIEFSSEDGRVVWREKFSDGSVGPLNQTEIETSDKKGVERIKRDLLRERGLDKTDEQF